MKPWISLVALLIASNAWAAGGGDFFEATLVKDVSTMPDLVGSDPDDFHAFGGKLYFSANRHAVGREIFATDGVAPAAALVADFAPGLHSSNARLLGSAGGRLVVFALANAADGAQIWSLDPVSGARAQLSAFAATADVSVNRIGTAAGRVFFGNSTDGSLWASDGTAAGTVSLLQGGGLLVDGYDAARVCLLPDQAMFLRRAGANLELWRSNGTVAGTQLVTLLADAGEVRYAGASAGRCHFATGNGFNGGWTLWRSDGTAAGSAVALQSPDGDPYLVTTPEHAYLLSMASPQSPLYRADQAQPIAMLPSGAFHLSVVDGAIAYTAGMQGARNVEVLQGSGPTQTVQYNGAPLTLTGSLPGLVSAGDLVFARDTGKTYRIDVATATATLIASDAELFVVESATYRHDGVVYGTGDGDAGREVWRSDGTPAGTRMLHDVNPVTRGSLLGGMSAVARGNQFYFAAIDLLVGGGLYNGVWRSDGTAAGTQPLARAAYDGGNVGEVERFGNGIVFSSYLPGPAPVRNAYRVDADFRQVERIASPATVTSNHQASDGLLTYGCSGPGGSGSVCALRAQDGVAASVIAASTSSSIYEPIGAVAGIHLYFMHRSLWRSDGTAPGTFVLAPLVSLQNGSQFPPPPPLHVYSYEYAGRRYFQACNTQVGASCGVYATDGTSAPTMIANTSLYVSAYAPYQGQFVFVAGTELWRSGGTAPTTQFAASLPNYVYSLAEAGGLLHLIGYVSASVSYYGYFVSDATQAGTRAVPLPAGGRLQGGPVIAYDNDNVLFSCYAPGFGWELCAADAAGTGVRQVVEINPGIGHGYPGLLARTTDAVYVRADDGEHGWEPWRIVRRQDALFANSFEAAGHAPADSSTLNSGAPNPSSTRSSPRVSSPDGTAGIFFH